MLSRKIGLYENQSSWTPYVLPAETIVRFIKDGRWKGTVKEKAKEDLPCFTVSGVFNGAKKQDNLTTNSGLLSLDLDNVGDKITQALELLSIIKPHIYSYFKSVSGNGLCVLVAIDEFSSVDDFKEIYESIYDELKGLNGFIKFDHLNNLNRLRYVSYDPDAYLNVNAEAYTKRKSLPKTVEFKQDNVLKVVDLGVNKMTGNELIEHVVRVYTDNSGSFGGNGKPRHDWVLGLTRWLCKGGVGESDAQAYILQNYDLPERGHVWAKEVSRCVRDSYSHYQSENGKYTPTKNFKFDDIKSASDLSEVRTVFLQYIGQEETKLVDIVEPKLKAFLETKLNFYKTIYRWL